MILQLRRASPEQADALSRIALAAKAHWGYPEHWMQIWRPQLTFAPEYFEANESWVVEMEGNPIAFYTLQNKEGIAWIEHLWVLPEYMSQGIGRQLFLHATSLAVERGYKILQLEADPNAIGFYEKMGMYKIGERHSEVEGQSRALPIMEMLL